MNQRKIRGKTQKLYFIDRDFISVDTQNFSIMGSTGNIYTVSITNKPTCTCPDYTTRHKRCKHIYFALLRIMKIDETDVDNEEYADNELFIMFSKSEKLPSNKSIVIDPKLKEKWNKIKNSGEEAKQRKVEGDCPICLEEMMEFDGIDFCKYSCGNNVHKGCLQMWLKKNSTCVYCRANLVVDNKSEQFKNLLL